MKRSALHSVCVAWLVLSPLSLAAPAAEAGTLDDAKLGLHLKSMAIKNMCTTNAPPRIPCEDFPDQGLVGVAYHMYVVASRVNPGVGLAGVSFGIDYDGVAGSGADVFSWTSCGDLQFPDQIWPGAGSGNLVTWTARNCQNVVNPSTGDAQAFAGFFYVYAYDADLFSIVERPNTEVSRLAVADCSGAETSLTLADAGQAAFSPLGDVEPYNPCSPPPVATCLVEPEFLSFGTVLLGESREGTFTITNVSPNPISGEVDLACAAFSILAGAGPYTLLPGEIHTVTVRFTPLSTGTSNCVATLGTECGGIHMGGTGSQGCELSTEILRFPTLTPGDADTMSLFIYNRGLFDLPRNVWSDCVEFQVLAGAGTPSIPPGDSLEVFVRFRPLTSGHFHSCGLHTPCGIVDLVGVAEWKCSRSSDELYFGAVRIGDTTPRAVALYNESPQWISGEVAAVCGDFQVAEGAGPYAIAPGDSLVLQVLFVPTVIGARSCELDVGVPCGTIRCEGIALGATPLPAGDGGLGFPTITVGETRTAEFRMTNTTSSTLSGIVSSDHYVFTILSGGGPYTLLPGRSRDVTVRFQPASRGAKQATVQTGVHFATVPCFGVAIDEDSFEYVHPRTIGLHLTLPTTTQPCAAVSAGGTAFDQLSCVEFTNQGFTGTGYYAYAIATNASDSPTIRGVGLGIQYGPGTTVFQWSGCGDMEAPSPGWPGTGSDNLITWTADHCQDTLVPGAEVEGAHAVAGAFYLYAYATDTVSITRRTSTSESGPTITDCLESTKSISTNATGSIRLSSNGASAGHNPCRYVEQPPPTSVELLSFRVTGSASGQEITWEIAGSADDLAGFHLHRELADRSRTRITESLLHGETHYRVIDTAAPQGRVSYWLAEHSRTGDITWHGPVEAEVVFGTPLPMTQNRPNPFSSRTAIGFHTEREEAVRLTIFDLAGREVIRLVDTVVPEGGHEVGWDGRDSRGSRVPAGIYLYRLETTERTVTLKLVIMP